MLDGMVTELRDSRQRYIETRAALARAIAQLLSCPLAPAGLAAAAHSLIASCQPACRGLRYNLEPGMVSMGSPSKGRRRQVTKEIARNPWCAEDDEGSHISWTLDVHLTKGTLHHQHEQFHHRPLCKVMHNLVPAWAGLVCMLPSIASLPALQSLIGCGFTCLTRKVL